MPQTLNIPNYGTIEFPDDASDKEIQEYLDKEVNPKLQAAKQPPPAPAPAEVSDWRHPKLPQAPAPTEPPKPKPGILGSFLTGVASGLLPSGGMAATAAGLEAYFAPTTGGASLALIPPTLAAGWLFGKLQQAGIHKYLPEAEKYQQAAEEQHALATGLGGLVSFAPYAKLQPGAIFQKPFLQKAVLPASIGATIGAVQPMLLEHRRPTLTDIGLGAAGAVAYGEPYSYVKKPGEAVSAYLKGKPDASQVSQAAAVHGDVPQQAQAGVPPAGGVGGVPPQTEARISLTPQEEVLLRSGTEKLNKKETLTPEEHVVLQKTGALPPDWRVEAKLKYEAFRKSKDKVKFPAWEELGSKNQEEVAKTYGIRTTPSPPEAPAPAPAAAPPPRAAPTAEAPAAPTVPPVEPTKPPEAPPVAPAAPPEAPPPPVETVPPLGPPAPTAEQLATLKASLLKRVEEIQAKVKAGKPIDAKDREDWKAAGGKESDLPTETPPKPEEPEKLVPWDADLKAIFESADPSISEVFATVQAKRWLGPEGIVRTVQLPDGSTVYQVGKQQRLKDGGTRFRLHGDSKASFGEALRNGLIHANERKQGVHGLDYARWKRSLAAKGREIQEPKGPLNAQENQAKVEAAKAGVAIEMKDPPPAASTPTVPGVEPDDVPFAKHIAYWDDYKQAVVLNRQKFNEELARVHPEQRAQWIERLINEESLHGKIGDDDALDFFDNMTWLEKKLSYREYTGFWSPEAFKARRGFEITELNLAREAIRQKMQRLSGGTRELIEAVGKERWKMQTIDALQRIISALREGLGTKASMTQREIINRWQANLDAAKRVVSGGPGAAGVVGAMPAEPPAMALEKRTPEELAKEEKAAAAVAAVAASVAPEGKAPTAAAKADAPLLTPEEQDALFQQQLERALGEKTAISVGKALMATLNSEKPDLEAFVEEAGQVFGMSPEQATDIFTSFAWKYLLKASPQRLAELAEAYDLKGFEKRKYKSPEAEAEGKQERASKIAGTELSPEYRAHLKAMSDWVAKKQASVAMDETIAQAKRDIETLTGVTEEQKETLRQQLAQSENRQLRHKALLDREPVPTKDQLERIRKTEARRQQFRNHILGELGEKIMKPRLEIESLKRNTFAFDDIDWSTKHRAVGGAYQFTRGEQSNWRRVSFILAEGSRWAGNLPPQVTKSLVALRHREAHYVVLVDNYMRDLKSETFTVGDKEVTVKYPNVYVNVAHTPAGDKYLPMSDPRINDVFDPVATFVLKKPVKGFRLHFKDMREFSNHVDLERILEHNKPAEFPGETLKQARTTRENEDESFWFRSRLEALSADQLRERVYETDLPESPQYVERASHEELIKKQREREELGEEAADLTRPEALAAETQEGEFATQAHIRKTAGYLFRLGDAIGPLHPHEAASLFNLLSITPIKTREDLQGFFSSWNEKALTMRELNGMPHVLRGNEASALVGLYKMASHKFNEMMDDYHASIQEAEGYLLRQSSEEYGYQLAYEQSLPAHARPAPEAAPELLPRPTEEQAYEAVLDHIYHMFTSGEIKGLGGFLERTLNEYQPTSEQWYDTLIREHDELLAAWEKRKDASPNPDTYYRVERPPDTQDAYEKALAKVGTDPTIAHAYEEHQAALLGVYGESPIESLPPSVPPLAAGGRPGRTVEPTALTPYEAYRRTVRVNEQRRRMGLAPGVEPRLPTQPTRTPLERPRGPFEPVPGGERLVGEPIPPPPIAKQAETTAEFEQPLPAVGMARPAPLPEPPEAMFSPAAKLSAEQQAAVSARAAAADPKNPYIPTGMKKGGIQYEPGKAPHAEEVPIEEGKPPTKEELAKWELQRKRAAVRERKLGARDYVAEFPPDIQTALKTVSKRTYKGKFYSPQEVAKALRAVIDETEGPMPQGQKMVDAIKAKLDEWRKPTPKTLADRPDIALKQAPVLEPRIGPIWPGRPLEEPLVGPTMPGRRKTFLDEFTPQAQQQIKLAVQEPIQGKWRTAEEMAAATYKELVKRAKAEVLESQKAGTAIDKPTPEQARFLTDDPPPAALIKNPRDDIEEGLNNSVRGLYAALKRRDIVDAISATRDLASNLASNAGRAVMKNLRLAAGATIKAKANPQVLGAAIAMIQSGFDKRRLPEFKALVAKGRVNAQAMINNAGGGLKGWTDRVMGKKWLAYQDKLDGLLDYADAHWNDQEMIKVSLAAKAELDAQYNRETAAGINLRKAKDYVPGRYEGSHFNDASAIFGEIYDVLGRNFRAPKTHDSYFHASAEDPYIAQSLDIAVLTGHRVRQGLGHIERDAWFKNLMGYIDPDSSKPVVEKPLVNADGKMVPANLDSTLVSMRVGGEILSMRKGYVKLFNALNNKSALEDMMLTRNGVHLAMGLKHMLLVADFFHLARIGWYGGSLLGPRGMLRSMRELAGGRSSRGLSVLDYNDANIDEAVNAGLVSADARDWSRGKVTVNYQGRTQDLTRREIATIGMRAGLNNGGIRDALYKGLIENIPGIGRYNKWLFDDVTRGFITESFVRQVEQLSKKHPNVTLEKLGRDVAKDMNVYFGNLGRQGLFKSKTLQDVARLAFLAPQWVEGLARKELGAYGRFAGTAYTKAGGKGYRTGLPTMGALGTGMGAAMLTMFGISQALNLITRRKFTWQNDEEEHKWDAFIPIGEQGVYFSPTSVYNELSHDVYRMSFTKPKFWDVISQIGENKLSPYGRIALVGARSQTPTGQYLTTTPAVLKEMASQAVGFPIAASRGAQWLGSQVAPGLVSPPQPGAMPRQLFATLGGIKVEPGVSPVQQMRNQAEHFMASHPELKKETGWHQVQTDEPSYSKLRVAIRDGNDAAALAQWNELRKTRSYGDMVKAMQLQSQRPLTGSRSAEAMFMFHLSPAQRELYGKSMEQRFKEFGQFIAFLGRSRSI